VKEAGFLSGLFFAFTGRADLPLSPYYSGGGIKREQKLAKSPKRTGCRNALRE
jgi:hypothetical protein